MTEFGVHPHPSGPLAKKLEWQSFDNGIRAALVIVESRIRHWETKRVRMNYPAGIVETELRLVEKTLKACEGRSA